MNHLCCSACLLRFAPGTALEDGTCPRCGQPLASLATRDAIGYQLSVAHPELGPAGLDALTHALAEVMAPSPRPR